MKKLIFDYARMCKRKLKDGRRVFGGTRNLLHIRGIVIHFTGAGLSDTAKNNADYFATGIDRQASAHIFIDWAGKSARSLPLKYIAFSVGKMGYAKGKYFATLSNENTINIELCGLGSDSSDARAMSTEQYNTLVKVVKYIKKKCPNVDYIVRHYDIVKKDCPAYYVMYPDAWKAVKHELLLALKESEV